MAYKWEDYTKYDCECGKPAVRASTPRKDGTYAPRVGKYSKVPLCSACYIEETFRHLGGKEEHAISQGFISSTHKSNLRTYRVLKYKIPMCENSDGKLGFRCLTHNTFYYELTKYFDIKTGKIKEKYINNEVLREKVKMLLDSLQVDHIDGNPENNNTDNLMVLCPHCHGTKTSINKDGSSPGNQKRYGKKFRLNENKKQIKERQKMIFEFGEKYNLKNKVDFFSGI
jgi:hypothetical protein